MRSGAGSGHAGERPHSLIRGESESGPESAYFQIFGPFLAGGVEHGWRGVQTGRYMYARTRGAPWVLYDLKTDPYELQNLAGDPAASEVQARMEAELGRWMRQSGDSWDYDWTAPIDDGGRLYKHETFYTVEEFLGWAAKHPERADL